MAQRAFPYVSAAFGMIAVGAVWLSEDLFRNAVARGVELLSRPHLVLRLSLPPYRHHGAEAGAGISALVVQLTVYVLAILALSTLFFAGFERPILAARPYYSAARRAVAARPRRDENLVGCAHRSSPSRLALRRSARACSPATPSWPTDPMHSIRFSPRRRPRLCAGRDDAPTGRSRGRCGGARLPSVRNRAAGRRRSLPLFDRIAAGGDDRSPTYSYRAAHANPTAFATWWFYY